MISSLLLAASLCGGSPSNIHLTAADRADSAVYWKLKYERCATARPHTAVRRQPKRGSRAVAYSRSRPGVEGHAEAPKRRRLPDRSAASQFRARSGVDGHASRVSSLGGREQFYRGGSPAPRELREQSRISAQLADREVMPTATGPDQLSDQYHGGHVVAGGAHPPETRSFLSRHRTALLLLGGATLGLVLSQPSHHYRNKVLAPPCTDADGDCERGERGPR